MYNCGFYAHSVVTPSLVLTILIGPGRHHGGKKCPKGGGQVSLQSREGDQRGLPNVACMSRVLQLPTDTFNKETTPMDVVMGIK